MLTNAGHLCILPDIAPRQTCGKLENLRKTLDSLLARCDASQNLHQPDLALSYRTGRVYQACCPHIRSSPYVGRRKFQTYSLWLLFFFSSIYAPQEYKTSKTSTKTNVCSAFNEKPLFVKRLSGSNSLCQSLLMIFFRLLPDANRVYKKKCAQTTELRYER